MEDENRYVIQDENEPLDNLILDNFKKSLGEKIAQNPEDWSKEEGRFSLYISENDSNYSVVLRKNALSCINSDPKYTLNITSMFPLFEIEYNGKDVKDLFEQLEKNYEKVEKEKEIERQHLAKETLEDVICLLKDGKKPDRVKEKIVSGYKIILEALEDYINQASPLDSKLDIDKNTSVSLQKNSADGNYNLLIEDKISGDIFELKQYKKE